VLVAVEQERQGELALIAQAGCATSLTLGLRKCRQQERHQNSYDSHHHQQFHQGESRAPAVAETNRLT
jgi:hypothetical protein